MILKMNGPVLLLCILQLILLATGREHICSHKNDNNQYNRYHIKPDPRRFFNNQYAVSNTSRQLSSDPFTESFKMAVFYDDSVNTGLSADVRNRLKTKIIPILTEYYDEVLSVRPLKGPILEDRSCTGGSFLITNTDVRYCAYQCEATSMCGTAAIPSEHLKRCAECKGNRVLSQCTETGSDGPGVDASFVLYVSAKTAGSCPTQPSAEGTVAYAGSCGMEDEFDRPIVGYANFCPYSLNNNDHVTDDFIISVAKHEILHALGFSYGQYAFWRDANGKPRTARDKNNMPPRDTNNRYIPGTSTFRKVDYRNWDTRKGSETHTVFELVTPKIVEEGKKHFGCSNLEGVEVENQGGTGTALSHWEKRILENEGMTGIVSQNPKFTRLTFALLEDSGWYKVDYSYAENIQWGGNRGCDFASGSCKAYMDSQKSRNNNIEPFCDYLAYSNGDTSCTLDRSATAQCNMVGYASPLPDEYEYFNTWTGNTNYDASVVGGRMQIADFCPYNSGYSNGLCSDTKNAKTPGLDNSLAETYGKGSRCVVHGNEWRAQSGNRYIQQNANKSGCYKYICSGGKVSIVILGKTYACPSKGTKVVVSQTSNEVKYDGSIICPSCSEICYDDPNGGCSTEEEEAREAIL